MVSRSVAVLLTCVLFACAPTEEPLMGSAQSIRGVWMQVEREVQGCPNAVIQSGSRCYAYRSN